MNASTTLPPQTAPRDIDIDLVEQARPGHGIPSQDPNPEAQIALTPEEAEREAKSVLMGGGLVGGAAVGAAIGAAIAGPVGVLVGATVGAVTGAVGGGSAGAAIDTGDANAPPRV